MNQLLEERLRAHVRSRGYEGGEPLRQELMAPDNSVALVVDTEGVATALSLLNSGLIQVWCSVLLLLLVHGCCERGRCKNRLTAFSNRSLDAYVVVVVVFFLVVP